MNELEKKVNELERRIQELEFLNKENDSEKLTKAKPFPLNQFNQLKTNFLQFYLNANSGLNAPVQIISLPSLNGKMYFDATIIINGQTLNRCWCFYYGFDPISNELFFILTNAYEESLGNVINLQLRDSSGKYLAIRGNNIFNISDNQAQQFINNYINNIQYFKLPNGQIPTPLDINNDPKMSYFRNSEILEFLTDNDMIFDFPNNQIISQENLIITHGASDFVPNNDYYAHRPLLNIENRLNNSTSTKKYKNRALDFGELCPPGTFRIFNL